MLKSDLQEHVAGSDEANISAAPEASCLFNSLVLKEVLGEIGHQGLNVVVTYLR